MKQKVLIAEDDPDLQEVLKGMFDRHFDLTLAEDGEQAVARLNDSQFQFMILDMHLPKLAGIEICKLVNEKPTDEKIPIIVLSGDISDKLVKEAYQLGINDYIGKPFNVVTFYERVLRFSDEITQVEGLRERDRTSSDLAQTTMMQAASYGRSFELVARLNNCFSAMALMKEVADSLETQGYNTAIQLRSETETFSYDVDSGECSTVELQIFNVLKDQGRIYQFGRRTIFNDQHVSILVKNMPYEGTLSYDSIIDVAAKLILAVNSRFISLLQQDALLLAHDTLKSAINMLSEGIQAMEVERRELVEQVEMKIGLSFHELDMTEAQEAFFIDIIQKELRGKESSTQLTSLLSLIQDCAAAMESATEEAQSAAEEAAIKQDSENNANASDDIELF